MGLRAGQLHDQIEGGPTAAARATARPADAGVEPSGLYGTAGGGGESQILYNREAGKAKLSLSTARSKILEMMGKAHSRASASVLRCVHTKTEDWFDTSMPYLQVMSETR
jgi:hypothetical protein